MRITSILAPLLLLGVAAAADGNSVGSGQPRQPPSQACVPRYAETATQLAQAGEVPTTRIKTKMAPIWERNNLIGVFDKSPFSRPERSRRRSPCCTRRLR